MRLNSRFIVLSICLSYLVIVIGCTHTSVRKTSFVQSKQQSQKKKTQPITSKSGDTVSKYGFIWPIEGELLSFFGERSGRIHQGIDIAAKRDSEIHAAMSGIVKYNGNGFGAYGNVVIIDHDHGYSTVYAHNSKNLVKQNQHVTRGKVIALAGDTGNASGVHLHFEIRKEKEAVNPLLYLP